MTTIRALLLTTALFGGLAACGSDGDSGAEPAPDDTSAGASADTNPPPADASPAAGPGTGTLTMADGTVYTLVMSTCNTSENDAERFVLPESYDLFGTTSDGAFRVQLIRAGLDEEFISETATLEGDFDDGGQNAELLYTKVIDTLALTVDGGNVAGTVTMTPIGPVRPHGDEIDAVVDVRC